MVKAGDAKAAVRAAEILKDKGNQGSFLMEIAFTQAQEGDPQGARRWAETLESPIIKSRVLLGIARGLSERLKPKPDSPTKPLSTPTSAGAKPQANDAP